MKLLIFLIQNHYILFKLFYSRLENRDIVTTRVRSKNSCNHPLQYRCVFWVITIFLSLNPLHSRQVEVTQTILVLVSHIEQLWLTVSCRDPTHDIYTSLGSGPGFVLIPYVITQFPPKMTITSC